MIRKRWLFYVAAFAVTVGTSVFGASLTDLGAGTASGISTDGSVVALTTGAGQAAIWSQANGLQTLGAYTTAGVAIGGGTITAATWVPVFNGSDKVIVAGNAGGSVSAWVGDTTGAGAWYAIGTGTAYCTSAASANFWIGGNQGTTTGSRTAYRYKASSVSWSSLGLPAGYNKDAYIYGISNVGSYAGRAQYGAVSPGGARGAVGGGTLTGLNPIIGPQTTSNEAVANAVSATGNRAGGWSTFTGGQRQGTIWDINPMNTTPVVAVPLLGTDNYAEVQALNADGSYAAGYARDLVNATRRLWLWNAADGTRDLATLLTSLGYDLTGWTLTDVKGLSGDALTIVGTGTYGGVTHSWVAQLPEPGTLVVLALGGLAMLRRRK